MTIPMFVNERAAARFSRSMLSLAVLSVGCLPPEIGTPATTAVQTTRDDGDEAPATAASVTATTAEAMTSTSTTSETTALPTTSSATSAADTSPAGTSPAGTTSSSSSETTTGETTTGEATTGETTTGETTTGETTTAETEPCLAFASTPDVRFDALLAKMQAVAISASASDSRPSGLSVAIVVDGELRHAGGVGTRAKDDHPLAGAPIGADTLFWIASTSKWIHGTMVSSLVEDGLLDLDDPITAVLPDYTETNGLQDSITLHNLLTMTSGLASDSGCYLFSVSDLAKPVNGCEVFSKGPGTVLQSLFEPKALASSPYHGYNTTANGVPGLAPFKYSNWGIMLSGRIAEVAGGAPHPDLVAERVFKPAQMCSATYAPGVVLASGDYAVGSGSVGWNCPEPELGHDSKAPWEPDELACGARGPNGNVRASAVDAGRFAAAFLADLNGAEIMLGQEAAHRMLCPGGGKYDDGCLGRVNTNGFAQSDSYGYTNFHQKVLGYDVYSHGGSRPGYGALFWIVPKHDFAVVILGNEELTAFKQVDWAKSAIACWLDGKC